MNKTMIAMAVALLAGLAPVPTTAGAELDDCIQPALDEIDGIVDGFTEKVDDIVGDGGDLKDLLAPATNSANLKVTCIGEVDCEALVGSLTSVSESDALCNAKTAPCGPGETGKVVGGVDACVTTPAVEQCPAGYLGKATNGIDACFNPYLGPGDVPSGPKPKGGACAAADDGDGWGNPHASCKLPCALGSVLAIGIASADPSATVYGSVNCGGTGGPCGPTLQVCFGGSEGPATKGDDAGACEGTAEEFWDGPMTLACVASPGVDFGDDDPTESARRIVCRTYPDFPTCKNFAAMSASCLSAHPELLVHGPEVVAGLFPSSFGALTVDSYVGGVFLPDGGVVTVVYAPGQATCELG